MVTHHSKRQCILMCFVNQNRKHTNKSLTPYITVNFCVVINMHCWPAKQSLFKHNSPPHPHNWTAQCKHKHSLQKACHFVSHIASLRSSKSSFLVCAPVPGNSWCFCSPRPSFPMCVCASSTTLSENTACFSHFFESHQVIKQKISNHYQTKI